MDDTFCIGLQAVFDELIIHAFPTLMNDMIETWTQTPFP